MLKPGALNRVARGKITEYHTRALSQRPKAKDVLFRACKHGFHLHLPTQAVNTGATTAWRMYPANSRKTRVSSKAYCGDMV